MTTGGRAEWPGFCSNLRIFGYFYCARRPQMTFRSLAKSAYCFSENVRLINYCNFFCASVDRALQHPCKAFSTALCTAGQGKASVTRQDSGEVCCWIPTNMTLFIVDGNLGGPFARCDSSTIQILRRNVYFMRAFFSIGTLFNCATIQKAFHN